MALNLMRSPQPTSRVVCKEYDTHHHSLSWRFESMVEAIWKLALRRCLHTEHSVRTCTSTPFPRTLELEPNSWPIIAKSGISELRLPSHASRERTI